MGIRLIVSSDYSLDMTDLDTSDAEDGEITKFTSTTIKGEVGDYTVTISGKGFKHDSDGYLTDGSIYGVSITDGGQSIVSLTGANVSVDDLIDVFSTYSTSDDLALIKTALRGDDYISGSRYVDYIYGYGGNDTLLGKGGADRIHGGSGNDIIIGGGGKDRLYGDNGRDTFIFNAISDSPSGSADTIDDFSRKEHDKIDLSNIDASAKAKGDQDFDFIGASAFHGKAGELRYEKSGDAVNVYGDVNGDKKADFSIHLDEITSLKGSDFVL